MKKFLILFFVTISLNSCSDSPNHHVDVTEAKPKKAKTKYVFNNAYGFDEVRHVHQSGMHYIVIYYNGTSVVNLTKDSLEFIYLQEQRYKDSLQREVFKKYLQTK